MVDNYMNRTESNNNNNKKEKQSAKVLELPEVRVIQEPTSRWKTFALKGHKAVQYRRSDPIYFP